jgi:hypothetical protein
MRMLRVIGSALRRMPFELNSTVVIEMACHADRQARQGRCGRSIGLERSLAFGGEHQRSTFVHTDLKSP